MTVEWLYVFLAAAWCGIIVGFVYRSYKAAKLEQQRYRLFAIRDKLFKLVVDGDLAEDSLVFREASRQVNLIIRHVRVFTLDAFARSFLTADDETFPDEEKMRQFSLALKNSSPKVRAFVEEFFATVVDIMLTCSWRLRWHLRSPVGLRSEVYRAYTVGQSRRDTVTSLAAAA